MDDDITSSIEFLEKLQNDEVTVKFRKKDNSIRIMKCTLNFDKIPKKDQPKRTNVLKIMKLIQNKGLVHVFDLEKKGWRAINLKTAEWLQTATKKFKIKL